MQWKRTNRTAKAPLDSHDEQTYLGGAISFLWAMIIGWLSVKQQIVGATLQSTHLLGKNETKKKRNRAAKTYIRFE